MIYLTMRLDNKPPQGRKPLRTCTEIAEMLGVSRMTLVHALQDESAPTKVTSKEMGHNVVGKNRVWYEPKAVIRWWHENHGKH